ncbi:hypothetical protein IQ265_23125 [Nodosilinea sp. LEGE 06152]|uniref:hypothetical protein n=1 Tax=Nodosilinea sp. LEGE 06152 TaxID=2777966 RepID=UPI00187FD795|nr:hypothetical protein [Nodosilinea sp. LEGE 06152]MBE9159705.1 hypothetical protein [Nodosilinea sp. LEGE 06152]
MDNSPFRRIVLPALLASSAGFAALTWPMASDQAVQVSERLPEPFSRWADSALIPHQHKEFSIRYIGFAILSSVAIGIGTAEVMRSQQGRSQRRQSLLNEVLEAASDRPLVDPTDIDYAVATPGAEAAPPAETERPTVALDWSSLLQGTAKTSPPDSDPTDAGLLSTALEDHALYHIQGANQQQCLALAVEGAYYRYYRSRPDVDKAQKLVQQLQQQGKQVIATVDDNSYVVWVRESESPQQVVPWPRLTIAQQG